jgi:uncharacterized protein (DUF736 family)
MSASIFANHTAGHVANGFNGLAGKTKKISQNTLGNFLAFRTGSASPRPLIPRRAVCSRFASRPHWADSRNERQIIMTTIAKLTKQQDGSFLGTLSGIGLQTIKIELQPVTSESEKAPDYLVISDDMEIGAAFHRENKRGEYTLVVLDSPALAAPIFSYLRKSVKAGYTLEWERSRRREQKDAE